MLALLRSGFFTSQFSYILPEKERPVLYNAKGVPF